MLLFSCVTIITNESAVDYSMIKKEKLEENKCVLSNKEFLPSEVGPRL